MPRAALKMSSDVSVVLQGWAINLDEPGEPLAIDLRIDGETVGRTVADRRRPGGQAGAPRADRMSFAVMAPLGFYDGAVRAVELADARDGTVLFAKPIAFKDLRLDRNDQASTGPASFGTITQVSDLGIRGWIVAPAEPDAPIVVSLRVDGTEVARTSAAQMVRYLPFPDGAARRRGFRLRLPAAVFDGAPHALEVRRVPDGTQIPSPLLDALFRAEDRPRLAGAARFAELRIVGEIVDPRPDAFSIDVALMAGDVMLDARRDLDAAKAGFAFDLADVDLTRIAGPLELKVLPDGDRFAIAGADPLARSLSVAAAREDDGVRATFTSRLDRDWRARVALTVDRAAETPLELDFTDGRRRAEVRFALPADARRLEFRLVGAQAPLAGGVLDVAAHPAVRALHAQTGHIAPLAPLDPGDAAVQAALAARATGLAPPYAATGVSGEWTLDAETGRVEGWAIDVADPLASVTVELLAGGEPVAARTADEPRLLPLDGVHRSADVGFAFALDQAGPASSQFAVRVAGRHRLGPETVRTYVPGAAVHAGVDRATYEDFVLEVAGWASDVRRPGAPVTVEVMAGGVRQGCPVVARSAYVPAPSRGDPAIRPPADAVGFTLRAVMGPEALQGPLELRLQDGLAVLPLPAPSAAAPVAAPTSPPRTAEATDVILGAVDRASPDGVGGWACCEGDPERIVDLMLILDGAPWAYARPHIVRGDLAKRFGSHGRHGFLFDLPPNIGVIDGVEIEVRPVIGVSAIARARTRIEPALADARPSRAARTGGLRRHAAAPRSAHARASVIVVNLNGPDALERFLANVVRHEDAAAAEWIVIDHGARNAAARICADVAAKGLDVVAQPRGSRFSVGASKNVAASRAGGDVLIFMDDAVELTEPVVSRLAAALDDPAVGAAGLRLTDAIPERAGEGAQPIRHLGVHIGSVLHDGLLRPFEARAAPDLRAALSAPVEVPAVTGALLAIRRADFRAVGGFHADYRSGGEDADLCLALRAAGKTIVSLNDVEAARRVAQPAAARTDLDRAADGALFNARWGASLRRALRTELLARPGFWTGHGPVIAFAAADFGEDTEAGRGVRAQAAAIQAETGAHLAFLAPERWRELRGVDVLIASAPTYDVTKAVDVAPHLVTIAWAQDDFDLWGARDGMDAFAEVWAPSPDAADALAERLGLPVDAAPFVTEGGTSAAEASGRSEVLGEAGLGEAGLGEAGWGEAGLGRTPLRRAPGFGARLGASARKIRFGIKIAAPGGPRRPTSDDHHVAEALAAALRRLGHLARVDAREAWTAEIGQADDVALTLRGLMAYEPRGHQKNIAWLVSHPDEVSPRELNAYDHVYVASELHADRLRPLLRAPVEPLLRCADPGRVPPRHDRADAHPDSTLFVGDLGAEPRPMVGWALEAGLDLAVYGRGWHGVVEARFWKGRHVPNEHLGALYRSAAWTLCDHGDDMRRAGFLSNRIFDVLGAGGDPIVDDVPGLGALMGDRVRIAADAQALKAIVTEAPSRSPEARRAASEWVAREHSFDARAKVIAARAEALLGRASLTVR